MSESAPAGEINLAEVWTRSLATLTGDDVAPNHRAFVRLTRPLALVEDTVLLAAPDDFAKSVLEQRLRPLVTEALCHELGRTVRIAVTVDATAAAGTSTPADSDADGAAPVDDDPVVTAAVDDEPVEAAPAESEPTPISSIRREPGRGRRDSEPTRLNPRYLFETFVIGSSNRFAHAAAVAVAEAPAKAYNPLFIYGDSGLGKTHLLHAIGHYAANLFPSVRVRYVSSEEFTNDFINAIRDGRGETFRRRYREVDILLVDDIQFLENKEQTQEEFFHTFNTLHNANKQIVISSDRPP
ncbi:MAG TPA: DnaA/Hda family protein, partial [Actinomycetes bacterium]|nr:DnaA/Hda family protein [Actinomycetes bacterium]